MERKFQNELQIPGVKYKMYIKIISIILIYFFPVRNPKKSHTRPLLAVVRSSFSVSGLLIRTAHNSITILS